MPKSIFMVAFAAAATIGGCKKVDEARIADKASCAAIARSVNVNQRLIAGVTQYLEDADHAAAEAERWEKKEVAEAENGTGEYSGAANRALRYAGSALSLCESVRQVHAGIESIAHTVREPTVHADERTLQLDCFDETKVGTQDSDAAQNWGNERAAVQIAESRYLTACKAAFGADDGYVVPWPLGVIHERATKRPKEPSP